MHNTKAEKPPLSTLISVDEFEVAASKSFSPKVWAFVSSAATDLHTKRRNSSVYSKISLRPRILRNVSSVDLNTQVLGQRLRMPVFSSPTAMARLIHPEGEKDVGRAVKSYGIAQCVSTSASYSLQDIMGAIEKHTTEVAHETPVYFQLYVDKDREKSRQLLQKVSACGAKAIFVTVDSPRTGKREADERIQADESISSPVSGVKASNDSKGGAIGRTMGHFIDDSVTWDDIAWISRCAPDLKIVLKGIQTAEDAVAAMEAGVDGIVVSNHGGRTLDTSSASILVLLEIHRNCPQVFESMDVLVDGGIKRGTDIFKALCLGAKAVGIGRGTLYGLNYGFDGVSKLLEILRDELETTMKLCGVTRVDQLHPGYINTLAIDYLIPGGGSAPRIGRESHL